MSDLKVINFNDFAITTVLWATGFGYDFSYLNSSLLDKIGKPKHLEGKMMIEGLYCIGFPWLRKKKSGLVYGVNEDAKIIVENILHQLQNLR
ncbi:putative oxidoreductase CzcO [compost metagenome]